MLSGFKYRIQLIGHCEPFRLSQQKCALIVVNLGSNRTFITFPRTTVLAGWDLQRVLAATQTPQALVKRPVHNPSSCREAKASFAIRSSGVGFRGEKVTPVLVALSPAAAISSERAAMAPWLT